jgi:hypothetical protein
MEGKGVSGGAMSGSMIKYASEACYIIQKRGKEKR